MPRRRPRLTTPLIRTATGLEPTTWAIALDRVAAGFSQVRDTHGGSAFGMFSCSKATNETNFLAQKFARVVMGSSNIDSCNRT